MFENLTNKFEEIFSSLKKSPSLDEAQVDEGLRGIRQALLEADVSLEVAKDFIEKVKPKALGQEIIRSTSPGDMVVKIVYDELVNLLGESNSDINLNAVPPVPMMMVGLQGSGKTTTTAKLAKYLENTKKKKVMMVSLDIYRPAAQEQLRSLGEQNNILTLPIIEGQQPADICRRAISAANLNAAEIVLFDTAGRTQIDLQMMSVSPFFIAANAVAHAAVPQALVRPAPLSQTLTFINSLLTTVAKVTLHLSGNKGWCSISGPIFFISKFSLLSTKKITWGFPTFTAAPPV
jgi:signal recognition particle subunit SRP54